MGGLAVDLDTLYPLHQVASLVDAPPGETAAGRVDRLDRLRALRAIAEQTAQLKALGQVGLGAPTLCQDCHSHLGVCAGVVHKYGWQCC